MARKLAHTDDDSSSNSDTGTNNGDKGTSLTRRKYVTVGAAATAALVTGSGSITASSTGEEAASYWTDFSEAEL
ncbi:hypothetical protein [Halorubrum sp. DTA46]|uniref:hypothetical protein n=1 Tax=Halorubrum sp. DTA46 TaxID=3402162 RepID=UPI003AAEAD73